MQLDTAQFQLRLCHKNSLPFVLLNYLEYMRDGSRNNPSLTFLHIEGHRHILRLIWHNPLHREGFASSCLAISKDRYFLSVDDRSYNALDLLKYAQLSRFSVESLIKVESLGLKFLRLKFMELGLALTILVLRCLDFILDQLQFARANDLY